MVIAATIGHDLHMSILFVCLGNICRSPTAEAVFRARAAAAGLDIATDSAGTGAWHIGNPPDTRMQSAARIAGYDLSPLRARQITPSDFRKFSRIIVMDDENLKDVEAIRPKGYPTPVELFLPYGPTDKTNVPDPYYEGGFEAVVKLIEDASDGLINALKSRA
jgi:protein-tyrosine phosphatase